MNCAGTYSTISPQANGTVQCNPDSIVVWYRTKDPLGGNGPWTDMTPILKGTAKIPIGANKNWTISNKTPLPAGTYEV